MYTDIVSKADLVAFQGDVDTEHAVAQDVGVTVQHTHAPQHTADLLMKLAEVG